jgi:predicted amidohydrolase
MSLVIAGLQHAGRLGDVAANVKTIDEAARAARAAGADVLVTPEMFLTGYNLGDRLPELVPDDPAGMLGEIARRHGIAIVAGAPERLAGGGITNSAIFVDADGAVLLRYRKSHLFGALDRAMFEPGDRLSPLVHYRGVGIAVMICYDVEFPETVRSAAMAGADVVLVPTAQMEPYAHIAERLIPVRAWESQVYVAYIDRCGSEGDLRYVGRSSIAAPSGDIVDSLGASDEGLIYATIDPAVVRAAREENPYLADRRANLYLEFDDEPGPSAPAEGVTA